MKNIEEYIESGIIESYVLGLADPSDRERFEHVLSGSQALQTALLDFELKMERFALQHQSPPPAGTWDKIEDRMRETPAIRAPETRRYSARGNENGHSRTRNEEFLAAHEISSTHIRVHKHWKTAFIVVFILAKIFLATAIYYFVQQLHAEKDILKLEKQIENTKGAK